MSAGSVALVVGVTGVTGTPMAEQLLSLGWKVYGLSRRPPKLRGGTPLSHLVHLTVDLQDAMAAGHVLRGCNDVTHVFHCVNDGSSDARVRILTTLLEAIDTWPSIANINLLQGMKYYGSNLGPFKTPAKETDPRIPANDFFYGEEDLIIARQRSKPWTWTALRPHAVCGYAAGNPMNLATVLGVYGSILREEGSDFHFPGSHSAFSTLFQLVDADLLARAAIHISTNAGCGNQAFNINNGDIFRWKHMWPVLASFFGLRSGGPSNDLLADFLSRKKPVWRSLVKKHQLLEFPIERAPGWVRGDYSDRNSRLACEHDIIADTIKLRRAGFSEVMDSEAMFLKTFARLRDEGVIP